MIVLFLTTLPTLKALVTIDHFFALYSVLEISFVIHTAAPEGHVGLVTVFAVKLSYYSHPRSQRELLILEIQYNVSW